jgi:hypothetical protein
MKQDMKSGELGKMVWEKVVGGKAGRVERC